MLNKKAFYSIIVIVSLVALSPRVSFGVEQFNRDLSFGSQQDSDVTKLQEFLSDEGLYSGPITGNFFSLTLKAVKAFQTREGITPAAGYFGPKTRTRASELLGTQAQSSNQQAVTGTGQAVTQSVASQNTNSSVGANTIQSQLQTLLSQISLLQQQLQIQQQTQQSISDIQSQVNQQNQIIQQQQQTLQQIQPQQTTQPTTMPKTTPPDNREVIGQNYFKTTDVDHPKVMSDTDCKTLRILFAGLSNFIVKTPSDAKLTVNGGNPLTPSGLGGPNTYNVTFEIPNAVKGTTYNYMLEINDATYRGTYSGSADVASAVNGWACK